MNKPIDICLDFDGTCVFHEFPNVGNDIPNCVNVLKKIVSKGHNIILFTMRSDRHIGGNTGHSDIQDVTGIFLTDAINWFSERDIPLYGIQSNPTQINWTTSPKAYGHLYIDDAALGCPVLLDQSSSRPYVEWIEVERMLINIGVL